MQKCTWEPHLRWLTDLVGAAIGFLPFVHQDFVQWIEDDLFKALLTQWAVWSFTADTTNSFAEGVKPSCEALLKPFTRARELQSCLKAIQMSLKRHCFAARNHGQTRSHCQQCAASEVLCDVKSLKMRAKAE